MRKEFWKKFFLSIIIIAFIITILIFLFFMGKVTTEVTTGKVIENLDLNFSYTKAICNSSNYCQDYEIKCFGNKLYSIKPITGAVVQFHPNWEDPRKKEEINNLC